MKKWEKVCQSVRKRTRIQVFKTRVYTNKRNPCRNAVRERLPDLQHTEYTVLISLTGDTTSGIRVNQRSNGRSTTAHLSISKRTVQRI